MASFLALLPRSLTTFLYAVAALLRFYGNINTTPIQFIPLTILQWSFLVFCLGTASLLVNLGLEWNAGNRAKNERTRAEDERTQERERTTRRARIQTRFTILQIQYQLDPNPTNRQALTDFLIYLQEYGEF